MYTVLASRWAPYDFVVVEKHLCLICALYWILQQGSQSDCGPLQSTAEAIGSIAQRIDPTFSGNMDVLRAKWIQQVGCNMDVSLLQP